MARLAVVVALCGVIIASVADASPLRTCPSTCLCRHTLTVNKADCRDIPEWDLKTSDAQVVRIIPPTHPVASSPLILSRLDMFPKVQMLSVTNRSIVELTSGNLPTLQVLDLSNNKISRFNDQTFHHMPVLRQLNLAGNPISLKRGIPLLKSSSIRTLDLGYSGLTHIPNGSLSGIPNLTSLYLQGNPLKLLENVPLVDRITIQELDLSYCKLTKVPNHSLDNLASLQRLFLKGNDLKTILVGTLPVNIHYLDLSANRIRDVPLSPLSTLKNLTNLELAKNPVRCTCELITFLDRMSEQNVISEKMIVCAEPVKYAKVAWKDIDERELCKDDVTSEESTDSSSDDDAASSASVSFERDDISYETDGRPEEENRIMSQHPPPLSLKKLFQKPTRYQNMEENSIQSDQPYSNTSDEGAEHMNDFPATTVETIKQSHEDTDDLIVASGAEPEDNVSHITTSTEVSSKDITSTEDSEPSKGEEDDSLLVAVPPSSEDDVGPSTESQDKQADTDSKKINGSEETKTREITPPPTDSHETTTDRESLENEKEQEEDLVKAPDASVAVEEQFEMPHKTPETSEESTENPDAETFMKNEETIAMGKVMPEGVKETDKSGDHPSKTDENVENPVILASRIEGQAEDETEAERDLSHTVPSPSAEDPTSQISVGNSHEASTLQPLSEDVGGTDEKTDTKEKKVGETSTGVSVQHGLEKTVTEETAEKLSGSVHTSAGETTTGPSLYENSETEAEPRPDTAAVEQWKEEKEMDMGEPESGVHVVSTVKVESEKQTVKPKPSESAENALENGEFGLTETTQRTYGDVGVDLESAQAHSDNDTEITETKTESSSPVFGSQEDKNTPEIEEADVISRSEDYEHNEMTESVLAATESDSLFVHDKGESPEPSSSPNLYDAHLTSLAPSSSEQHKTPLETTTPKPETTSHREETNSGGFSSFFSFGFLPGNDKDQNHVSDPSGSSDDHVSELSGSSDDHVSETSGSSDDHVSETSGSSDDHVSEPSGSSDDHVSEPSGSSDDHVPASSGSSDSYVSKPSESIEGHVSEPAGLPSERSHDTVGNNLARMSDSEDIVVVEDGDIHTATMAYIVIAGVIVCIIIAVACVSLRSRPDKKRKGSAPVRIRGDNVSPGTEMKDMMNPLLEPIAESQTANEFHDDPTRRSSLVSIELNGQNGKFPVVSPVPKENGVSDKVRPSNGGPPQDPAYQPISMDEPTDVTEVVIEAVSSNGSAAPPLSQNGLTSTAPVNGKPPRQNGTAANKVKVVAGVIPPAVPRTPVYLEKSVGES